MAGENVPQAVRLTRSELMLRRALRALAVISGGFALFYVVNGVAGAEYPFVANSVAKDVLLVMMSLAAAADVRRFGWITSSLILIHLVLGTVLLAELIGGAREASQTLDAVGLNDGVPEWLPLVAWCVTDFVIAAVLFRLYTKSQRERYGLRYLGNGELLALRAVSEILTTRQSDAERSPHDVAIGVDRYLAGFSAHGKAKLRMSLFALTWYPLLSLRPPLWMMEPGDRRRFLHEQFLDEVADRRGLAWWRRQKQGVIRGAQQLCFLGFYSDPVVAERCGYRPLSVREPAVHAAARLSANGDRRRLDCMTPQDIGTDTIEADVLVVGSGAAGATLAYELAAVGRDVLVVERGRHVDPSEFVEDEPTQFSALYADGALNLSQDFRFQVLQGMCVGGSTVVNNAVALRMAPETLACWTSREGFACGLDGEELWEAYDHVERFLRITRQPTRALSPAWEPFLRGVNELGLAAPEWKTSPVSCNVEECVGCGLCNTGCAYGRKLSMLDLTLPQAQADFPGRVRIIAQCRVSRILRSGSRATGVQAALEDGSTLQITARDVVVSAGALASSVLLKRSGIGGPHVGRHVAFNLGTPMVAEFDDPIEAYKGLNITHVLEPPREAGYVLETWYQPIVAMSLFMPGWFEQHERNMRRYANMMCLGPVVASAAEGLVRPDRASPRAVKLKYTPSTADLVKLRDGMKAAGRIMLAAGATRVMPPSFRFRDYRSAAELERLPGELLDNSDFLVNTSHPQGGNRMSSEPRDGVVDPTFRVHGMENLYVCDASVFPSAILVNPQLTVMALARCAARHIA